MANLVHRQFRKMHKNEDIFVKQAQEFSPRLFYFALWHGYTGCCIHMQAVLWQDYTINQTLYIYKILYSKQNLKNHVKILTYRIKFSGMDQYFVFQNSFNKEHIQVLDLYVYNIGMTGRSLSLATAIGILKSIVSLTLLVIVNNVFKKTRGESII